MAIFSKRHSGKKSDDQPKVIVDKSVEEKVVSEAAPAEGAAKEASPAETPASADAAGASGASETAAAATEAVPTAIAPSSERSEAQEIEPEALTPPVVPVEHRFGIDDAIQLMRSLPADPNMALVTRVVRVTLSAVHVSVDEIVQDALRKEAHIKESIAAIEAQMADLDKQLANLRRDIATHQADLKETMMVRERLHMADQYKSLPPPITTTMPRATPSKPFTS